MSLEQTNSDMFNGKDITLVIFTLLICQQSPNPMSVNAGSWGLVDSSGLWSIPRTVFLYLVTILLQGRTWYAEFNRNFLIYFLNLWIRPMWWYSPHPMLTISGFGVSSFRLTLLWKDNIDTFRGRLSSALSSCQLWLALAGCSQLLMHWDGKSLAGEMRLSHNWNQIKSTPTQLITMWLTRSVFSA